MIDLTTEPAEVRFTVSVTRKATGKVETFDMIGHTNPEGIKQLMAEQAAQQNTKGE